MSDSPLHPSAAVLAKVGSIVVHAEEMVSPGGHTYDHFALLPLLRDPDVVAWIEAMQKMALVPVKRD